jgi:hypothetical protein
VVGLTDDQCVHILCKASPYQHGQQKSYYYIYFHMLLLTWIVL